MKNPLSSLRLVAATLTVSSLLCLPAITRAAPVALYLNSTLSYLDASGNGFGLPFGPQTTGSLRAYTGGSLITALNNPAGPFSSAPYPGGPWAGNYGVTAGPTFIPTYNFVVINGVYGGLTLDLTSGTAKNGVAPTGVTDTWTGGTLNWGAANAYR